MIATDTGYRIMESQHLTVKEQGILYYIFLFERNNTVANVFGYFSAFSIKFVKVLLFGNVWFRYLEPLTSSL